MARKPVTTTTTSTAVVPWEEEMAKYATAATATVANIGGGNFFSLRAGVLTLNGQGCPNNEFIGVIAQTAFENSFYEGKFDENNPIPPTCFAVGMEDADLAPHATVVEKKNDQHRMCKGCPKNEYGSAETGRSKACTNRLRLAWVPGGNTDARGNFTPATDEGYFASAPVAQMKLPPTSLTNFAAYIRSVAQGLERPPFMVFTKIKLVPSVRSVFEAKFETAGLLDGSLLQTMIKRHEDLGSTVLAPIPLDVEERAAPPKPVAGRRATKKY